MDRKDDGATEVDLTLRVRISAVLIAQLPWVIVFILHHLPG